MNIMQNHIKPRDLGAKSDFSQDFKFQGRDELIRGIYHSETKRSLVYLNPHENFSDLISTCVHESIHYCIELTEEVIDMEQEHRIIHLMAWSEFIF